MKLDHLERPDHFGWDIDDARHPIETIGQVVFYAGAHGGARLTATNNEDSPRLSQRPMQRQVRIAKRGMNEGLGICCPHRRLPDGEGVAALQ
jgi:hypothetical protein